MAPSSSCHEAETGRSMLYTFGLKHVADRLYSLPIRLQANFVGLLMVSGFLLRIVCFVRVCLLAGHLAGHMEDSRTPAYLAPTYLCIWSCCVCTAERSFQVSSLIPHETDMQECGGERKGPCKSSEG